MINIKTKLTLITLVIVFAMSALFFLTNQKNKSILNSDNNPYGNMKISQPTIDILSDPNYGNQIVIEDLRMKFKDKDDMIVYYFSPVCVYCKQATPVLMDVAKESGYDIIQLNLLEYDDSWSEFDINSTPSLVVYKNGKEVNRLTGAATKDMYEEFLKANTEK